MNYHYPPIAGYARRRRRKDRAEPLFGKEDPRRPPPPATTLCGLTSRQHTRTHHVDCPSCRKIMERFPQLGNHLINEAPGLAHVFLPGGHGE